jgi:hypothetical protein
MKMHAKVKGHSNFYRPASAALHAVAFEVAGAFITYVCLTKTLSWVQVVFMAAYIRVSILDAAGEPRPEYLIKVSLS